LGFSLPARIFNAVVFPITTQISSHKQKTTTKTKNKTDAIDANESKHCARMRHWQSMQLESIRSVAVRRFLIQIFGQVDDLNGVKWALFDTYIAPNA
jgi:hypothetical protein